MHFNWMFWKINYFNEHFIELFNLEKKWFSTIKPIWWSSMLAFHFQYPYWIWFSIAQKLNSPRKRECWNWLYSINAWVCGVYVMKTVYSVCIQFICIYSKAKLTICHFHKCSVYVRDFFFLIKLLILIHCEPIYCFCFLFKLNIQFNSKLQVTRD